jgi:mannosyltransferase
VKRNSEEPKKTKKQASTGKRSIKEELLSNRYLQLIIALTIVGALIRLLSLGFNPIWLDEAMTLQFSINPFGEYWNLISSGGEVHPPLFYWLEHFMLYLGQSETILRLIPALAGIATIPLVYLLGRDLVDKNTGLLAATLLTFSSFHLQYSQEARMYSLLLLFLVLTFIFFLKARRDNTYLSWVLTGIFAGLAFWTHFFAAVFVGILFLFALGENFTLWRSGKNPKPFLLSLGILFLIALPLLVISYQIFLVRTSGAPLWGASGSDLLILTFIQFSGYNSFIAIFLLILFGIGLAYLLKKNRTAFFFIVGLILIPLILAIILAQFMPMVPRYLIGILPLLFIGASASWNVFAKFLKGKRVVCILLAIFIAISIPGLVDNYTVIHKDNWRDYAAILKSATVSGDVVVVMPAYNSAPFDYYYSNTTDATLQFGASNLEDVERISERYPDANIFFAFTMDIWVTDPQGQAINWLEQNAKYAGVKDGIYVFVRPPQSPEIP